MASLDRFRSHHRDLQALTKELDVLLDLDQLRARSQARSARQLLQNLMEQVDAHLADEDRGLYPPLLNQGNSCCTSLTWDFITGERPLRQRFQTYQRRWPQDGDCRPIDAFARESQMLLLMIKARLQDEQRLLFPLLEGLQGPTPMATYPTWAAPGGPGSR